MKRLSIITVALWLAGNSLATAGTISGKVHAEGKAGASSDAECGKYESRAFKFVERVNYVDMSDFIIYIEGPVGTKPLVVPDKPAQVLTVKKEVSQKKAMFSPHVLPVVVGTTVEWPNKDDIYHNVFSYSEAKPFDLGLYRDGDKRSVTFDKPGRVDVFCSIHSSMSCVVLVLENPYFTRATNNSYSIPNIPAGTYKLKAWHERMPPQIKEVTVPEHGEIKVDFTLGITGLPKY